MKKIFLRSIIVLGILLQSASASKDSTFNIYGINSKPDANRESHKGLGVKYNSEYFKIKVDATSVFLKSGAIFKFDPYKNWDMKLGLNYLHQKVFAPDDTNAWVDQYSSAFSARHKLLKGLYMELGGSYTKLEGANIGTNYSIKSETTKIVYAEIIKRLDIPIGTMDTSMNYGRVDYGLKDSEDSYGAGIDYYLTDSVKASYKHQHEENNNVNLYSFGYGMFFLDFADNISNDTNQATAGIRIAFDNLFDVSTWKAPTRIKPSSPESHRFETLVFETNMNIQSSRGVQHKQIDVIEEETPVNNPPTGESFSVDAGESSESTESLSPHINDADGDTMTVIYVGSGVLSGDIAIDSANTGINGTLTKIVVYSLVDVNNPSGNAYIDYRVSDGTYTSPTYRITFNNLSGI